ncbi:kinase-like domain-containing protein [Hypoxylon sp. NC1633]|nr:kinase-like domain-containing protein [Hypoxylon sp. NC1633]
MSSSGHIRDSLKQIDKTSWLVGDKYIVRYFQGQGEGASEGENCLWKSHSGSSYYTISDTPSTCTLPSATLPSDGHVRQIHDAGDSSAVFRFGEALILKVKTLSPVASRFSLQEHKTLAFLAKQHLSFVIPTVLFQFQDADKIYLFESYLPGAKLNDIWNDMDATQKEHVSTRIAKICSELIAFQSDTLTIVGDNWMDPLLMPEQRTYTPEALRKHYEELGMDCLTYVFSHNDLGPTNILLHEDQIAIIDWDLAGYYPLAWVRTKFAICGAFDIELINGSNVHTDQGYRLHVEKRLGDMGFPEVTEAYKKLWTTRRKQWEENRRLQQLTT